MSPYNKAKFAVVALRGFASRILTEEPVRRYGLSCSSLISSRTCSGIAVKPNHLPFLRFGKRLYYTYQYLDHQQFRPRSPKRWYKHPLTAIIGVLVGFVGFVGSGLAISVYFGNLETVPYTERKHFLLFSKKTEGEIGEILFQKLKEDDSIKGRILPDIDPRSIRVRLIAGDIIEALPTRLSGEFNWEIVVVDAISPIAGVCLFRGLFTGVESAFNAFCLPGGKIVVFTGEFKFKFYSDATIASVLARQIVHVVARHPEETMTRKIRVVILRTILAKFTGRAPFVVGLPYSQRMEWEADYTGLLLMASAGYDPTKAPLMYDILAYNRDPWYFDPSRCRSKVLREDKVMEEAYKLYEEVKANKRTEGIILRIWRKIGGIIHRKTTSGVSCIE